MLTTTGVIYSLLVSDIALVFTTTLYVYMRVYARVAGELLTRSSSRAFTAPFPLGPCELWRCLHIGASKTLCLRARARVGSSFETSDTVCAIANSDGSRVGKFFPFGNFNVLNIAGTTILFSKPLSPFKKQKNFFSLRHRSNVLINSRIPLVCTSVTLVLYCACEMYMCTEK